MYAPVADRNGRIAGVLSVEIISDFLVVARGEGRGARGRRAARSPMLDPAPSRRSRSRSDDSSTSCVTENGTFCFGWAADNYDRYVTPTLEHLVLVGSRWWLAS